MRATRRLVPALALLALMVVAACAATTAADVQKKLRAKITSKWATKKLKVYVKPYSSSARTRKGQFALIKISADSAERKGKHIRIMDLALEVKDVDLHMTKLMKHNDIVVQSRKKSTFHGKIMETDVNKLLRMKKTPIQNLRADFNNGSITFSGKYKLNIKLTGTLEVKDKYEIHFKPTKASIGILGIPTGIVNQFLSKLNPIVDCRDIPLRPTLKSVKVTPKYIQVTG